jgi:hypothetical protein
VIRDINLLLGVTKEKVEDLPLNMWSILESNSCTVLEVYHVLLYIHYHKGIETNGYLSCQWYGNGKMRQAKMST